MKKSSQFKQASPKPQRIFDEYDKAEQLPNMESLSLAVFNHFYRPLMGNDESRMDEMMRKSGEDVMVVLDRMWPEGCLDNDLEKDERQIFYAFQDAGLLTASRDDMVLYTGFPWTIETWNFNMRNIDRAVNGEYKIRSSRKAQKAEFGIYNNESVWDGALSSRDRTDSDRKVEQEKKSWGSGERRQPMSTGVTDSERSEYSAGLVRLGLVPDPSGLEVSPPSQKAKESDESYSHQAQSFEKADLMSTHRAVFGYIKKQGVDPLSMPEYSALGVLPTHVFKKKHDHTKAIGALLGTSFDGLGDKREMLSLYAHLAAMIKAFDPAFADAHRATISSNKGEIVEIIKGLSARLKEYDGGPDGI